jgi:hypothetical protein
VRESSPSSGVINQDPYGRGKRSAEDHRYDGSGAALTISLIAAAAQTGYGARSSAPSTSTFDRAWNHPTKVRKEPGVPLLSVAMGSEGIITRAALGDPRAPLQSL